MSECKENGSYKGSCCCNCKHLTRVMKHPLNKGEAKGSILTVFGYACGSPSEQETKSVIFFDSEHGMCEMHETA
ncbi:MAG: hypothetical protein GY750_03785 [Lentisphaerae bacterium]|nr:hypothetical protein [Lentisphaerota bacterium]